MARVTNKSRNLAPPTIEEGRELAEFVAAVAKVNFWYRRISRRFGARLKEGTVIPTYGLVKVIEPPVEFDNITGEDGIVVGGGEVAEGGYAYTVWVPSKAETYYLLGSAVQFTGVLVPERDVYGGKSIRVVVDEKTGEGRVVGSSSQS